MVSLFTLNWVSNLWLASTPKTTNDAKTILLDEGDQRMEVRVLANSLLGNPLQAYVDRGRGD